MYIVNGEQYETEDKIPDFGSIEVGHFVENGECEYVFLDEDRDKLSFLKSAGPLSLAYCIDKDYCLVKHKGEWKERGYANV